MVAGRTNSGYQAQNISTKSRNKKAQKADSNTRLELLICHYQTKESPETGIDPPTVHPKTEGSRLPSPPLPGACLLVACDYPKAMRGVVQSIYTGSKKNFRDEDFHISVDFPTSM